MNDSTRIIKEHIELWESFFEQDGITGDAKFWYPVSIRLMEGETQKAQVIQVSCSDKKSNEESMKGLWSGHLLGGKDCTCQMWMPKKVVDYDNRKAPYGLIKQNLEKCIAEGCTNLAKNW